MGHWKFGPLLLDSTSSSSSSCFHSEFPFSCYKAMTDPAKKALTIARTARNENFESFKLSTESWMHSASFISPSQIPYDSFQKLSPLFPPAWLHCNARSTNGLHTTIRTTLLSFTFSLVQLLYYSRRNIERCSNFHLSKAPKKSLESPALEMVQNPEGKQCIHRFVCALLGDSTMASSGFQPTQSFFQQVLIWHFLIRGIHLWKETNLPSTHIKNDWWLHLSMTKSLIWIFVELDAIAAKKVKLNFIIALKTLVWRTQVDDMKYLISFSRQEKREKRGPLIYFLTKQGNELKQ